MDSSRLVTEAIVLAGLIFVATLSAEEVRDLVVVAGQSNAVGFDSPPGFLPPDAADDGILFWWRCGDPPPDEHDSTGAGRWHSLQPQPTGRPLDRAVAAAADPPHPDAARQYGNFAQPEGGFGPEISLARTLAAKGARPLAILKVAFSGTSAARDWSPEGRGGDGSCYRALVAEYRAASEAAAARGIVLHPRAFVWIQGESDATADFVADYEANLRRIVEALRRDLGADVLATLLSVNSRFQDGKNPHLPTIVAAQRSLAGRLPRCVYVETAGAETLAPRHYHFTAVGTLEVGRRLAAALLELEARESGAPER